MTGPTPSLRGWGLGCSTVWRLGQGPRCSAPSSGASWPAPLSRGGRLSRDTCLIWLSKPKFHNSTKFRSTG
uniref:Uncharacterized protein n=1 Tax=Arundo donax TaxID=35708 RepID=A0A0A9ACF0_ARUDO